MRLNKLSQQTQPQAQQQQQQFLYIYQQQTIKPLSNKQPMKTRHGMQIKQLLQKKNLSRSRFNPQSNPTITSPSMKQSRQIIKKCQSTTSLHLQNQKRQHAQLQNMQKRYHQLYDEYKKIVEEQKRRAEMCKKQVEEIQKYQRAAQRDKKEIQRLRVMIGFVNRSQYGVQVEENDDVRGKEYEKKNGNDKKSGDEKEYDNKNEVERTSLVTRERKSIDSKRDASMLSKKSRVSNAQNNTIISDIQRRTNSRQPLIITKSRASYTNLLLPQQEQFSSQKKIAKKYQPLSSKLTESLLYHNKSSVDFRKKRCHVQKVSQLFTEQNSHEQISIKKSRMHSPNSRYKFVPSVEI